MSQVLAIAAAGISAVLLLALTGRAKKDPKPLWADKAAAMAAESAPDPEPAENEDASELPSPDEAEIPGDKEDETK